MTPDLDRLLQGLPQLRGLPPESLRELAAGLTRGPTTPGEYLFHQGAGPPSHLFYVISGTVEIVVGPPDDERVVSLSRAGQLVGWLAVFTREPFPASARVVEPGEVIRIPAAVFGSLLGRHPSVGQMLAATMARRLEDLFEEIRAAAARAPWPRTETFPFRKRVSEVMTSPAVTLPGDAPARRAATTMAERGTSAVVVCEEGLPAGIVTEKDLVQRLLAAGRDPDTTALRAVMSAPLASLPLDAYLYRALGIMRRRGVRHLAVMDGDRLAGILSMRALMAVEKDDTLALVERIEGAGGLDVLADARKQSLSVGADLLAEGVDAGEVSRLLSHVNRDLHRRVLEICLDALAAEGWGGPPVPFCFIVMGSHGRGESHFCTDQDHGMILSDYPAADWERVEPFFWELSGRVSEGLAAIGFPRCPGHVMCSNPVWRKPLTEWKDQVRGWFAHPTPNAVRYTTVFYDFLPVWGDASLARDLRDFITAGIRRNHQLLRSLFEEASPHKVPLTWFKGFVTQRSGPHRGKLDLKRSGLLFVVECARILALRSGIPAVGTLERLRALVERDAIPADEAEFIQTAYKSLLYFLLTSQAAQLRAGSPLDTYLDPEALPIQERYLLRHALEATGRLQGLVHASFGDIFF